MRALDHPVGSAADGLGALQSGDVGLFADLLHGLFGALGTLGDHLVDLLVGGHQIFLLCDLQQSHAGTGVLLGTGVQLGGKALTGLVDLAQIAVQGHALHLQLLLHSTRTLGSSPSAASASLAST